MRWHEELLLIAGDLVDVPRMSQVGRPFGGGVAQLQAKKITAAQAAKILGMSKRQVTRIASDLDGEMVQGRYLFDEAVVKEYADGRSG